MKTSLSSFCGQGFTSLRTRRKMVERLHSQHGIAVVSVLNAMQKIPRHMFIDEALASRAYDDCSLPLGYGQTISQPQVIARLLTHLLGQRTTLGKTLEIGTGTGYQAALLSELAPAVYTIERIQPLFKQAQLNLHELLRKKNIYLKYADGGLGWPQQAPFDSIVSAACAVEVPAALKAQMAISGRLVMPIGTESRQVLHLIERINKNRFTQTELCRVRFVPLLGNIC